MRGVIVLPTVRVWDENMDALWTLDVIQPEVTGPDQCTLTLPIESPIAEWILADSRRGAYLTIDQPGGDERWMGRLHHWTVDRVGSCEHCAHCMQKQLTTVWTA